MARALQRHFRNFAKRCEDLRTNFMSIYRSNSPSSHRDYSGKFLVILLLDCWADFNRCVVLDSAVGGCVTREGQFLPRSNISTPLQALEIVKTNNKNKTINEPRWHDARQCIAASRKLSISNYNKVALAVGASDSPSDEIRLTRNFFAHEKSDCADKLLTAPWFDKTMSLSAFGVSGAECDDGRTRFEHWVDELELIAFAAVA